MPPLSKPRREARGLSVAWAIRSSKPSTLLNFGSISRRSSLRADVSKYRPEVYKSEKSKILKKIHKVALGKILT